MRLSNVQSFLGYGFCMSDFAKLWSKKTNLSESEIKSKLFTDAYYSKGVIKEDAERESKKSLFEQFVLQPLWDIHKCGLVDESLEALKV